MRPHGETLLHPFAAAATVLRRVRSGHCHHSTTSFALASTMATLEIVALLVAFVALWIKLETHFCAPGRAL
jgi:hypothetical protein